MCSKILYVVSFLIFSSCAHQHYVHGEQKADVIPAGYRVHIGPPEVKEGDEVNLFQDKCIKQTPSAPNAYKDKSCKRGKIGTAKVLKVLDHDTAIIEPNENLVIDDKVTVEKQ